MRKAFAIWVVCMGWAVAAAPMAWAQWNHYFGPSLTQEGIEYIKNLSHEEMSGKPVRTTLYWNNPNSGNPEASSCCAGRFGRGKNAGNSNIRLSPAPAKPRSTATWSTATS
jgi:hypothetical protein